MKNYINKYSVMSFFLGIVEQLLVALSTVSMIQLGHCIEQLHELTIWMIIFIMSLFMVFLPRYGYQRFLIMAKYHTFQEIIQNFEMSFRFKPYLAKEKAFINERKVFFHNETWNVVNESYDFMLDFILTLVNICFSIGVIGISIEKKFILGYLIAFLIALLFCIFSRKKTEILSFDAQNTHVNMNAILLHGWDTILADNNYNILLWENAMEHTIKKAVKAGIHRLRYVSNISGLAMAVSAIPIFLLLIQAFFNSTDIGTTTALVVTLPRQVNTVQYLSILITSAMSWNGIHAKIKGIQNAVHVPEFLVFKPEYINFSQIDLEKNGNSYNFASFEELLAWEKLKSPGRITIRGRNGAGKSTLFIGLKMYFHEEAYYFSPNMEVYFTNSLNCSMSVGETILTHMQEILKNVKANVLLLDEWDANLDTSNIMKINNLLNEMAETKCIFEIRHRVE